MALSAWRLVGFDARETELEGRKTPIPDEVREVFLLRPEIEQLYSIDTHMWPTQFLYYPHIRVDSREPPLIATDQECECDFSLNLTQMRGLLAEHGRAAILVAVELLVPSNLPAFGFPYSLIDSTPEPQTIPEGSTCLGFDVADSGFWSGLSNCGYSEEDRARLRPEWQSKINDFGLLKSEQDAIIFKEMTDARVPEHAPFWGL
jgi:hypothetical protein